MSPNIAEELATGIDRIPVAMMGSAIPPRDPDEEDEDEDREEDEGDEKPPVVREPDEK